MMHKLEYTHHTDTSELLSTKLAPPRLHRRLISREPLLARLDAGVGRKLTLLSAPAGFGKTTLVADWLHKIENAELRIEKHHKVITDSQFSILNSQFKVAWVVLDAGDNDPARFWRYVMTACQTFGPAVGAAAFDLLHSAQQPPLEAALTLFINDLAQLSHRCILVLEDYHVITTRPIHKTLAMLLDHLPATLHLMIITCSDPPLPLARLRARNDLNELRAAGLRFSPAEAQSFLQQALPFQLTPEVVARLGVRTEGWAAGLRMLALALQGRPEQYEIEHFLDTFAGSHWYIVEYLAGDMLGAQPEPLQVFLLQTSILSRLTGSLCDAVTGRTDSASILEQIERANLFLTPLDGAQQWYRYHALFAEAMRYEARRRLGADGLRRLYSNASCWHEQHGQLAEAVETAIAAQEFPRAAELIGRLIELHGFNNEVHTLRRWIEQLLEDVLSAHPALCLNYALAILFTEERRAPAIASDLGDCWNHSQDRGFG